MIVAFAMCCGSLIAQNGVDGDYPSHWSDFYAPNFEMQGALTAFIQIDGEWISAEEDWHAYEVGFFILKSDGTEECRGHDFLFEPEAGWIEIPYLNASPVYYTEPGDAVFFKLYNHVTEVEYDYVGSNIEVLTGEDHWEVYDYDEIEYTNGVNLYFATPGESGITKDIVGYGDGEGGYYLIASPVVEPVIAEAAGMLENSYDLYYFNQSGDDEGHEWFNYKAAGFDLEQGRGYLYANSEDVTLTFVGTTLEEEAAFEKELEYDGDAELAGWNLIGNPFAVAASVDKDMYVMNEDGTEIIAATDNVLDPMEGAFVIAEGEGEMAVFTPSEPTGEKGAMAVLNVSSGSSVVDRAIVRFGSERMLPKFQMNANSTKVYIERGMKDYAIVSGGAVGEMPVGFRAEREGSYTLSFSGENVEFGYLHLMDNMTGADIDLLATPSYSFSATPADNAGRFRLVFATVEAGNGSDFAYMSDGNVIVSGEGTLQVVDMTGRIVSTSQVNGMTSVNMNAAGVYVLQLTNGSDVKTQKIVVK